MRRCVGLLPGRQVAARVSAIGRRDRQSIVIANVAQGACHCGMAIRQRETGCTVIENSGGPSCNRMAGCALRGPGWKSRRDVVRYVPAKRLGALECCLMASITIRRTESVVVVHMAGSAGRRRRGHMRSRQSKPGNAVIERCSGPSLGRMTSRTVRGSESRSRCRVHRIIRLLPGR